MERLVRAGDGERYTGQARTRANIQNHTRWQQVYYRQTVEQMTGDHGIQAPDRSQVVGLVPTVHQIKVGQQRVLLGICQANPQVAQALLQQHRRRFRH